VNANAQLAYDTILQRETPGIPSWLIHVMEHTIIEQLAGSPPGSYSATPDNVYVAMQRAIGTCMLDQYIPQNPLSIGAHGYENKAPTATTGAETVVVDGIEIDSPEAVAHHIETVAIEAAKEDLRNFDAAAVTSDVVERERHTQSILGPDILKVPYGYATFPHLLYSRYGYVNYFMAYALYPELIEELFSAQADYAVRRNAAAAEAYRTATLPPLMRLDHDIADSRGTLVDVKSLDRLWFPHFARAIEPLLAAGVRLIWHCDGNLMEMVPRLLEVGLHGFQGFQYEDGMDYQRICRMTTRDGAPLIIVAGVSVTRTLPMGIPDEVRREMIWLVENGPPTGLFLGGSSSIAPGVKWANIQTLVEGLNYYRAHGRP